MAFIPDPVFLPMISLYALQNFTHQGKRFYKGDTFEVAPIEAAALTYQKKARFVVPGSRTVKTRDLVPEPPAPEPEPEPVPTRRRYRRRDLMADE